MLQMKKHNDIDRDKLSALIVGDMGFRISAENLADMGTDLIMMEHESLSDKTKLNANGLLVAAIVLFALACEAGMKTLIMEGERDTHDLKVLFDRLTDEEKEDIRKRVVPEIEGDFEQMLNDNKLVYDSWLRFYIGGVNIYEQYVFLKAFVHAINIHVTEVVKENFSGMNYYLYDDSIES